MLGGIAGTVSRAQFAFGEIYVYMLLMWVLASGVDSSCEEAFKVVGSCGLNGPVRSPRGRFFEQMVGWVIDLIEKYIRASPAV